MPQLALVQLHQQHDMNIIQRHTNCLPSAGRLLITGVVNPESANVIKSATECYITVKAISQRLTGYP